MGVNPVFTAKTPIIQLKNLSKTYTSSTGDVKALSDISLDIFAGEVFGIIGTSGAGKSTLVRTINLLERPTEGAVLVDGQDLSALPEWQLHQARQQIGMIFQQFNLLMQRTALGNVLFPLEIAGMPKAEAKTRAAELLKLVGLEDKAAAYPSQLSGGQKQRVAIARALATNPKVLLCDEATSALDPTTTRSILALLRDINRRLGITIVIITHEMAVIEEICHRVAIIDQSRIAEVGRVEDIFSNPTTDAARRLVYPDGKQISSIVGERCCRIVFDGSSSYHPVIASMILECKATVNIMYADMKDIDGKAFGQLILQLPEDRALADKCIGYLRSYGLSVEEVSGDVV